MAVPFDLPIIPYLWIPCNIYNSILGTTLPKEGQKKEIWHPVASTILVCELLLRGAKIETRIQESVPKHFWYLEISVDENWTLFQEHGIET